MDSNCELAMDCWDRKVQKRKGIADLWMSKLEGVRAPDSAASLLAISDNEI